MSAGIPRLQQTRINSLDVDSFVLNWKYLDQFDRNIQPATVTLKRTVSSVINDTDTSLIGK